MKRIITVVIAALMPLLASAAGGISVQAPNLVASDEQFTVRFTIEGDDLPSEIDWQPDEHFILVYGPAKSKSSSVSIVNGKYSKSSQVTFSYALMPKGPGSFPQSPAMAVVNGETLTSKAFTIEVVDNGAQPGSAAQPGSNAGAPSGDRDNASGSSRQQQTGRGDLYLSLFFNKNNVIVGEPVIATLKLYLQCNLAGFEDAKMPTFNGFWSEETYSPSNLQFKREKVGDKIYETSVIRQWKLIPQQAGDIEVEPAELVCLVNVRPERMPGGSIFDSFFQDDVQQVRRRLNTGAAKLHVSGLPSGAPASFSGAVGRFKMDVRLSADSLKAHDAASLVVSIEGTGNMSMIQAPKLSFPPDFEVYDVKAADKDGRKEFEYPFIPRSGGDFVIEPVNFSYFELEGRKYVTLSGPALPIHVEAAGEGREQSGGNGVPVVRSDVRDLGRDIRFIYTGNPAMKPSGKFLVSSVLFLVLLAVLLVLAVLIFAAFRNAAARRADVGATRGRAATKMARKRLTAAGGYLKNNLYTAFYEELHRALLGYIGDKLNMDSNDMSKDNISARLAAGQVPDSVCREFTELLDACEFARYAPDSGHEAMNAHYESAVNVISSIDSHMRGKKRGSGGSRTVAMFVVLLAFSFSVQVHASAPADSLWTAGCEYYAAGQWNDASDCWEEILESGLSSAELYYNIGNARFKCGDLAHSILYYNRALKADPSYTDARFNLEFASSRCKDRIDTVPEFFLKTWLRKLCYSISSDIWAVLLLLFFTVLLAGMLAFGLSPGRRMRKAGFIWAVAAFVVSGMCLWFSLWQKKEYYADEYAVIVVPVSVVRSSPGDDVSTELFLLHEGTRVRVVESLGGWSRSELSDGRQGWVKSSDVEVI